MAAVHVLGAGSIGCLVAHHLARSGLRTEVILRSPDRLAALRAAGYRITVERPGQPEAPEYTPGNEQNWFAEV